MRVRLLLHCCAAGLGRVVARRRGQAGGVAGHREQRVHLRARAVPQVHASTLVETTSGRLLAAWFGGTEEGHPDVSIWVARHEDGRWSPGVKVADGVQDAATRHPTWNPVLFQPRGGPLMLFYKVGPSRASGGAW